MLGPHLPLKPQQKKVPMQSFQMDTGACTCMDGTPKKQPNKVYRNNYDTFTLSLPRAISPTTHTISLIPRCGGGGGACYILFSHVHNYSKGHMAKLGACTNIII